MSPYKFLIVILGLEALRKIPPSRTECEIRERVAKLTVDLLEGKPIDDHPEVVKKGKGNHHRPIVTETSRRIEDEGPVRRARAETPRSWLSGISPTTALLLLLLRRVPPETVIQRRRALINCWRVWPRLRDAADHFSLRLPLRCSKYRTHGSGRGRDSGAPSFQDKARVSLR